jgi:hypothetical protein
MAIQGFSVKNKQFGTMAPTTDRSLQGPCIAHGVHLGALGSLHTN